MPIQIWRRDAAITACRGTDFETAGRTGPPKSSTCGAEVGAAGRRGPTSRSMAAGRRHHGLPRDAAATAAAQACPKGQSLSADGPFQPMIQICAAQSLAITPP